MIASLLQKKRRFYKPVLPEILKDLRRAVFTEHSEEKPPREVLRKLFPETFDRKPFLLEVGEGTGQKRPLFVGAVFSGGQASGGHNVLGGIFHALKEIHPQSRLFGFLNGPSGIPGNEYKELYEKEIHAFLNQGGFDLIGTGRTKIETEEQLASSLKTCQTLKLDGLVIIGGDDSNTNAAVLAEYFLQKGCQTRVVGVPKTIDGDLRSADIEMSFGFDSACKTYAEIIGNIARDALSAKKYYHFIKLMGRSASHVTLECALYTHPNFTIIGEEKKSLGEIVQELADLIGKRYDAGKEYGVILIPEGLLEFSADSLAFATRDPHGNVQLSQIDTQGLLIDLTTKELGKRQFKGKLTAQGHFLGYEGRSCFPTNFDANYAYSLGILAALAVRDGVTGAICSIQHLKGGISQWTFKMVPIVWLMHLETRMGQEKPVIQKTIVDLQGAPYAQFVKQRKLWEMEDDYQYPGPIQFFGDPDLTDAGPLSLH
ncbi:MAG TPA: 6-phosphofructokinase [Chlamydiales bacterium]|nr:6-phosphofructokinase [Chlamydiales bacterium]